MAVDYTTVVAAAVLVATAWAVLRLWVPGGSLAPAVRQGVYRNGLSRRVGVAAALIGAVGVGGSAVVWEDALSLWWALPAGLYLGGVLVGAVVVSNRPRQRALSAAEATRAGRVTDGRVAVSGTVRPAGETLRTPFTGTEAVCFTYSVAQYAENVHPARSGGSWFVTDFGHDRTAFAVEDDSGTVAVDPTGAWLSVAPANAPTTAETDVAGSLTGGTAEREVVVEAGDEVPERTRAFCAERATSYEPPADGIADRDTRFKERLLAPGDPVVVVGRAERRVTDDARAETVVSGGGSRSSFVAAGTVSAVRAGLEQTAGRNAKVAAVLSLIGLAGLYGPVLL